ncbi:MAG: hypothetical protein JWN34_2228 [Bryobacterales bacterium]|nr:hypothetical protein [Bryobacterales bacterium]
MSTKTTVRTLSSESGFEVEDVIIELVRQGLHYAKDPSAPIRDEHQRKARAALGLHPPSDERKKRFWEQELGLDVHELRALLRELGFRDSERARTLPKGAQSKLRAYASARDRSTRTIPSSPAALTTSPEKMPLAVAMAWRQIGQKRVSHFLEAVDLRTIHEELEQDAELAMDPISPPGVKSEHLLESACMRPQTGWPSDAKYPTVEMAAAALVHSVVNNHPFHNGNKRSALVAMMVFLDRNNHWLRPTVQQSDLYMWILEVARHRVLPDGYQYPNLADYEVQAMADWIRKNSRPIERSERPITWRQLKSILEHQFGCTFESRTRGKVTIRRIVTVRSRNLLRGFRREDQRQYLMTIGGEGREVGLGTVKSLRSALCLTEDFNIDSAVFYGDVRSADQFISKYQRVLRDLARV